MKPLAPILAALALSACMTAPEAAYRGPAGELTLDNWRSYLAGPGCIRPPSAGGNVAAAMYLAHEANRQGRCVEFTGPAYSANVMIAAIARDVRVPDPRVRKFHMHYATHMQTGEMNFLMNLQSYGQANLTWCLVTHHSRAKGDTNVWTPLSLDQIRRDCQ
jgi:hypothetical protein